jgi:hypothetical protein
VTDDWGPWLRRVIGIALIAFPFVAIIGEIGLRFGGRALLAAFGIACVAGLCIALGLALLLDRA